MHHLNLLLSSILLEIPPHRVLVILPREFLQCLVLGFGNEEREQEATDHEGGKDFEDVV